jgi:DNA-binding NtrC family response regulator
MVGYCSMHKMLRILIVDDKPAILLTYRIILQQQGHEVTAAPCYSDALAHLDACSFDLLLCDLGLDGNRNGFDVIEHAREKAPGIRSVLLTGYAGEEVAEQAAGSGITVLFKPVNVQELLDTVHQSGVSERAIA